MPDLCSVESRTYSSRDDDDDGSARSCRASDANASTVARKRVEDFIENGADLGLACYQPLAAPPRFHASGSGFEVNATPDGGLTMSAAPGAGRPTRDEAPIVLSRPPADDEVGVAPVPREDRPAGATLSPGAFAPLRDSAIKSPTASGAQLKAATALANAGVTLRESFTRAHATTLTELRAEIDAYVEATGSKPGLAALHANAVADTPRLTAEWQAAELQKEETRQRTAIDREIGKIRTQDALRNVQLPVPIGVQGLAVAGELGIPIARTADFIIPFIPVAGQMWVGAEVAVGRTLGGLGAPMSLDERLVLGALVAAPSAVKILRAGADGARAILAIGLRTGHSTDDVVRAMQALQRFECDRALLTEALTLARAGQRLSPEHQAALARASKTMMEYTGREWRGDVTWITTRPYDARAVRSALEQRYPGMVDSATILPTYDRNVGLAGNMHPVTGVPFDTRGYPILDKWTTFDARIPEAIWRTADRTAHMKEATRMLNEAINRGEVSAGSFTPEQLAAIRKGKAEIPGLTWHHHQDPGRMQLVDGEIHRETGHIGGYAANAPEGTE